MKRLALPCIAALLLAACGGDRSSTGIVTSPPGDTAAVHPPGGHAPTLEFIRRTDELAVARWDGALLPLHALLRDSAGAPLAGVTVRFEVTNGAGSLDPASPQGQPVLKATAVTDAQGVATVTLKVGPGQIWTQATVDGATARYLVTGVPPTSISLGADSVVLDGPGCSRLLQADVVDLTSGGHENGVSVSFRLADTTLAGLAYVNGTGTYSGMRRNATARKEGSTQLFLTYLAAADTVLLKVRPQHAGDIRLPGMDGSTVAVGDTLRRSSLTPTVADACGGTMAGAPLDVRYVYGRAATATAAGDLVAAAPGDVQVVARTGDISRTFIVHVRAVATVPGDTTVMVGDTVRYQLVLTDSAGQVTRPATMVNSGDPAVARYAGPNAIAAVNPGTAAILLYGPQLLARPTLHVVPRP